MRAFLFCLILCASPAEAGRLVGNGGDGVVTKGGKVYSLDLVEAGVEENPYIEKIAVAEEFRGPLQDRFLSVEKFPTELLLRKISEIKSRSPTLAYVLAAAALKVNWNLVAHELLPIDDEDTSFHYGKGELVQLAARRSFTVFIDKKYFYRLPEAHKVALILHELVYLMMPVEQLDEGRDNEPAAGRQSSLKARTIVGELFKPNWTEASFSDWLLGQFLEDSRIRELEMPVKNPKFEYRFRKGGFTMLLAPATGKVLYQAIANGPFEIKGTDWSQRELEAACVTQEANLVPQPVTLKSMILVSPIGEEWIFLRQDYCQSRDAQDQCVMQAGLIASPVYNKGSHDRGFLFKTRDYVPAGAFQPDRTLEQKTITDCAAGLAKKVVEVANDPYGEGRR